MSKKSDSKKGIKSFLNSLSIEPIKSFDSKNINPQFNLTLKTNPPLFTFRK
jgi:hypothetical protein